MVALPGKCHNRKRTHTHSEHEVCDIFMFNVPIICINSTDYNAHTITCDGDVLCTLQLQTDTLGLILLILMCLFAVILNRNTPSTATQTVNVNCVKHSASDHTTSQVTRA